MMVSNPSLIWKKKTSLLKMGPTECEHGDDDSLLSLRETKLKTKLKHKNIKVFLITGPRLVHLLLDLLTSTV